MTGPRTGSVAGGMCYDLTASRSSSTPTTTTTRTAPPTKAGPPRPGRREKRKQRARSPAAEPAPPPGALPAYARNVEALVRAFDDATLPHADWTHAAHLVVALAYSREHGPAAFERLRDAIRRYNRATGTPETPTRGYHETITRAWFHLVLHFRDVFDDGRPLAGLAEDLVVLFDKQALFAHYSRERLLSPEARAGWVEPDLRSLPPLEAFTPEDRRFMGALARGPSGAPARPATAPAGPARRGAVTV